MLSKSSSELVVHALADPAGVRQALRELGKVTSVDQATFVVHPSLPLEDVKRQINRRWTDGVRVLPVLLDEDGGRLFPTGTIAARFRGTVDKAKLAELESSGLKVKSRNKFVPRQLTFEPESPNVDLEATLAALNDDGDVEQAWFETVSEYRRG